MSRNDAEDFAQRLYARVPGHYRVYDAERDRPLLALLRVIGEQVASVRQDLDALWDNFFIETCDDWVVPYIGALVGAHLLAHPVGQSNRLDVWNTVLWRRSKGTPQMLQTLAQAISGWPTDLAEFFQALGWSQNMNHVRLDRPLTPDLRNPYQLSLLGHAADPFAHAADFKPAPDLDEARVTANSLGIGRAGWGTPGRFQIRNVGFFVRRLQTFPIRGATPAAAAPGGAAPADAVCFTFNPLFRETPLFVEQSASPLTRAAFDHAPWATFGSDVAVRQFGVLLACEVQPNPALSSKETSFSFGDVRGIFLLHPNAGMRLMDPRPFRAAGAHFVITARWLRPDGTRTTLGELSTLYAASDKGSAYSPGAGAAGPGRLLLTLETGSPGRWLGSPLLHPSAAGRFPGAVVAVRAGRKGPVHSADGLYVYLPAAFVRPADTLTYFVADDGSTYSAADLNPMSLARASEGQVYPSRVLNPSPAPAQDAFKVLNRMRDGVRLTDQDRFGGAGVLVRVELFTGEPSPPALGAVATVVQAANKYPELLVPDPWPAFSYGPSRDALAGKTPRRGLLCVLLKPISGSFIPPCELVVASRSGRSLLVYLPELSNVPPSGIRFFVADDGSTYFVPSDTVVQQAVLAQNSFSALELARAALGQVLPISGVWPLQQRRPVAINLCRCERRALLAFGELGIDPELGRFAYAPLDPAAGQGGLSVDFVEAFSDQVGAVNFDRQLNPDTPATRFISRSGDADSPLTSNLSRAPVHASLVDALAAARDGDVIEIVDSATYAAAAAVALGDPSVRNLTVRAAAGQRPCLTFYEAAGLPATGSLRVTAPISALELNGLLISGGPLRIEARLKDLRLIACTLDPLTAPAASLVASDANFSDGARYLLCRCITGGLWLGPGVAQLIAADSIVDAQGRRAIAGPAVWGSPPVPPSPPGGPFAARSVHLERVTVFGRIACEELIASESLLDDVALVQDQQSGCVRFTRFEKGSMLPHRYQCVPSDQQAADCSPLRRCFAPLFNSSRFGRPDYAQLAAACPPEILKGNETQGEVGAFAGTQNPIRLSNLKSKLQEFLPVGLSAVIIAET